ncbi:MAG: hypothetical protein JO024_05765 [Candidatus Eremiobacteraeota bacterium]|nr:hypothetical protein [Candidatus Eremiobacteraeota bacterium]
MTSKLHVTNGDSVVYTWRKGGLIGTQLPWRDALHDGPVPAGLALPELSALRAQYLGVAGYGNPIRLGHDFQKRDATIARCMEFDEVVLWFEHDLYDQLQLLQILDYLAGQSLPLGSLQLIQSDDFLGLLAAPELLALQNSRRPVLQQTLRGASEMWAAYRAPTPERLFEIHGAVPAQLRHMTSALRRLFEEYPSVRTGTSRTQRHILEAVAEGAHAKEDIFRLAQLREEAAFLGDAPFYKRFEELCDASAPLLQAIQNGYRLTPLGRRVLAGAEDWLALRGSERWIGGVHLSGADVWRWDEDAAMFAAPSNLET